MNYKTYRVWMAMLARPNEWLSVAEVAHDLNMVSRQVAAIAGTLQSPPVYKERDAKTKELVIRVAGTDEEILAAKDMVISECFGITDDMKQVVRECLSPVGWMTVSDIADDTNVGRLDVVRILSITPNVLNKNTGSATLYKLG